MGFWSFILAWTWRLPPVAAAIFLARFVMACVIVDLIDPDSGLPYDLSDEDRRALARAIRMAHSIADVVVCHRACQLAKRQRPRLERPELNPPRRAPHVGQLINGLAGLERRLARLDAAAAHLASRLDWRKPADVHPQDAPRIPLALLGVIAAPQGRALELSG